MWSEITSFEKCKKTFISEPGIVFATTPVLNVAAVLFFRNIIEDNTSLKCDQSTRLLMKVAKCLAPANFADIAGECQLILHRPLPRV